MVISISASGPLPRVRQTIRAATLSPALASSPTSSIASLCQASRMNAHWRMTSSRPMNGPGSGQPAGVSSTASSV